MYCAMSYEPKVLVIDDEPYWLETLSDLFTRWHFRTKTAHSVSEAMRMFSEEEFDVVITDFEMPEMNGAELIENLRRVRGTTPMILMSCDDLAGEAAARTEQNIDAYVNKCGDPGNIRQCVESLVSWWHA